MIRFHPKSILRKVGLYDPSYRYRESAEWLTRAKDASVRKAIVTETLLLLLVHDQELTYHLDETGSNILKVLRASIDRQHNKKL